MELVASKELGCDEPPPAGPLPETPADEPVAEPAPAPEPKYSTEYSWSFFVDHFRLGLFQEVPLVYRILIIIFVQVIVMLLLYLLAAFMLEILGLEEILVVLIVSVMFVLRLAYMVFSLFPSVFIDIGTMHETHLVLKLFTISILPIVFGSTIGGVVG